MLRDYQAKLKAENKQAWAEGARVVMDVAATGAGKTVTMADEIKDEQGGAVAIAHRQELVSQISLALNQEEVPHGLIAPPAVRSEIVKLHIEWHGRSFYNPNAPARVAGVDTLVNHDPTDPWLRRVRLAVFDEGHHVLRDNKWGRAWLMMPPEARGLLFTAHALRADGAGLGRLQTDGSMGDGIVDRLVLGPHARYCIDRGYLTDYRIVCAESDVDMKGVEVGPSGEFNHKQLAERVHASKNIVGDTVKNYTYYAEGELGIAFAVDVPAAHEICDRFNVARIPAAVITAKTPIGERAQLMQQFRKRQLMMLVNVDTLGEGTDVPACVVVIDAAATASFQRCAQRFGRMLRVMVPEDLRRTWGMLTDEQRLAYIAASPKPKGIYIDQVGNVATIDAKGRHGLPDRPRVYSTDRREKKHNKDDVPPLRACTNPTCARPYDSFKVKCPYCGTPKPPPRLRATPAQVDGDLYELDPEVLRALRGEAVAIMDMPFMPNNASKVVQNSIKKTHHDRASAQHTLRDAIATWAGWQNHLGRDDRESYRRFFHNFRVDAVTAQTLGARDAAELEAIIRNQLSANNVVKLQ